MEGRQFDSFARSLVQSRRSFLGLGLGVTIGIAPLLGDAKKHRHKKKTKKKKKKCLDFADGECQGFGELCNPFGSPCCNCVSCIAQSFDIDEPVIYKCIPPPVDDSGD